MADDEDTVFYEDAEKRRERLHKEKLLDLREQGQLKRDAINFERSERLAIRKQELADKAKERLAVLGVEQALAVIQKEHDLEPEKRDMNYKDLIRESDIRLQSLQVELALHDQIEQNKHSRAIDAIYQTTAMEITKETARLRDEREKAIAIIESENLAKLILEEQQHKQDLKQKYVVHRHEMEKKEQAHLHELIRDKLQAELQRKNFSHEEKVRLITRLVAKELGLNEGEISTEQMEEWVEDFVRNEQ